MPAPHALLYTATRDLVDSPYEAVIRRAFKVGMRGLLVAWHPALSSDAVHLLERMRKAGAVTELRSEWPGSRAIGWTAEVVVFPLTPATFDVLMSGPHSLFGWVQPEWPENLCILRADESLSAEETPFLMSISQEEDAVLSLTGDDLADLLGQEPALVDLLKPTEPRDMTN